MATVIVIHIHVSLNLGPAGKELSEDAQACRFAFCGEVPKRFRAGWGIGAGCYAVVDEKMLRLCNFMRVQLRKVERRDEFIGASN